MANNNPVTSLNFHRFYFEIEWTIQDFSQYIRKGSWSFNSSQFSILDSQWHLRLYQVSYLAKNCIALLLTRHQIDKELLQCINLNVTFGIKNKNGKISNTKDFSKLAIAVKDAVLNVAADETFLNKSELLEKKSQLMPSGALTIICLIKTADISGCTLSASKLSDDFTNLFISKDFCDATFKVKGQEFPVHRAVLAARSPVFAAMFRSDMQEKDSGTANIPDVDPDAFNDFLRYLYSGELETFSSNVCEVYKAADKYAVEELASFCVATMIKNLSPENVLDVLILAKQFGVDALEKATQYYFNKNFANIVSTPQWASFIIRNGALANDLFKNMTMNCNLECKKV